MVTKIEKNCKYFWVKFRTAAFFERRLPLPPSFCQKKPIKETQREFIYIYFFDKSFPCHGIFHITFALASLAASASAAMALCSWTGSRTSLLKRIKQTKWHQKKLHNVKKWRVLYISTLSAFTPHGSVASSRAFCMTWLMVSLSDRISAKFLVPRTLRRVVAANSRVEWLEKGGYFEGQHHYSTHKKYIILIPVVFNVVGCHGGIWYSIIDNCIHTDRYRVTWKNLHKESLKEDLE